MNVVEGTEAVIQTQHGLQTAIFHDGIWWWRATKDAWETETSEDVGRALTVLAADPSTSRITLEGMDIVSYSVPLIDMKSERLVDLLEHREKDVEAGRIRPTEAAKADCEHIPPFMRKPVNPSSLEGQAVARFNEKDQKKGETWKSIVENITDPYLMLSALMYGCHKEYLGIPDPYYADYRKTLIDQAVKIIDMKAESGG